MGSPNETETPWTNFVCPRCLFHGATQVHSLVIFFLGDGNSSRFALGSISLATARASRSDSLAYCYTDN